MFYVPPWAPPGFDADGRLSTGSRIPLEFLESLFGDGVSRALKTLESERQKKAQSGRSELMDWLIAHRHAEMFKLG